MGETALPSRGHSEDIEVEWQFDALDLRPVERWVARLMGETSTVIGPENPGWRAVADAPVSIVDRYLDTEDWRIGRAGYVLRLRHKARGDEVTLKGLSDAGPTDGLRRRVEITEKTTEGAEWLRLDGPVGSRVAAMIGRRPLRHVLEVRTERRPFDVWIGQTPVAELALDETVIAAYTDEPPARLCRVEVEVQAEWTDVLTPLVDDLRTSCGLWPARLSKFEVGMLAHGMALPGPPDLGPTEVSPSSSIGELADAVVRRHLAALIMNEPGTRLGEDPEDLHDMRVATRRLRAAFSFFTDILPAQFSVLRNELAWLASILGVVRDLDVHLEGLEGADDHGLPLPEGIEPPLDHLRAVLLAERSVARAVMLRELDSPRYERLTTGLASLAQQGAARRGTDYHVPASFVLPDLVEARYRATTKVARQARRSGRATDYHRLRIRGKRLRYAVEFATDVYGEPARKFSRRLAKLQDALGEMQDASVAIDRLLQLAADDQHSIPPLTVFVMGALAARHQAEAARLMENIPGRLSQLDAGEWQDLASLMSERKALAAAQQPRPTPTPSPPTQLFGVRPTVATSDVGEPTEPPGHHWSIVEPQETDPRHEQTPSMEEGPPEPSGFAESAPLTNGHGQHGLTGPTRA
jgi:triphosphatase